MHFLIWFVPSVLVNALALCVIGLLYGPVFPACMSLAGDMLPKETRMVSMALMCVSHFLGLGSLFTDQGHHFRSGSASLGCGKSSPPVIRPHSY